MENTEKLDVLGVKEPGYKKVSVSKDMSDMKKYLDSQPKLRVKIPHNSANHKDEAPVTVRVNGYLYVIKRGEAVEVPEQIYNILEQGGYI